MVNNFDMAFYSVVLLLPGFVMNLAYSYFIPFRVRDGIHTTLRFIFFSFLNYCIWMGYVLSIQENWKNYWSKHPLAFTLTIMMITLMSPFVLGLVAGIVTKKELIRKLLGFANLNPIHEVPTAWEYIMDKPSWVIVTLKDGTRIMGDYGSRSFASSVPGERDIFIEKVCKENEEGEGWISISNSAGVWIPGEQILHIEFFNDGEENENVGKPE